MVSIDDLKALAGRGDADAQFRLAAVLDRAGDRPGADLWLDRAAAAGHPGALTAKAVGLLEAPPETLDAPAIVALLWRAVAAGSGRAAGRLAVLTALGLGTDEDWGAAVALFARSRAPNPQGEVDAVIAGAAARQEDVLRAASPRMARFAGALTPFECAYVIAKARPLLAPSNVVDPALGGTRASFRTSDGAVLGLLALDLPLVAIWMKLCRMAGVAPGQSELMGVLRYRPGEEYRPHHDYLPHDDADYSQVARAGQRVATLLTPLNADYGGGETIFPRLNLACRLAAGDSLLFENVDAAGPIEESLHAGARVTSGEKWMLTLWLRERRFWFW